VLEAALGALGYMLRGAVKSCADADDSAAAAAAALGGAAAVESELPALVQLLLPLLDHGSEGVSSDAAWCGGLATELLPAAQRVAVVGGALEAAAVGESHWWDCFAELLRDTRSAACCEVLAPLCAKVATAAKQGAAVCKAAKECALLACEQCVGEREDGEKEATVAMAIEGTAGGGIALIESLRASDPDADVADAGGTGTGAETTTETAATAARVLRGIDRALLATGVGRDELRAAHADAQFSVPEFECSISHDVMADPVVAEDGHTYERACIGAWLQRKGTSPLGGAAMGNRLVPNRALAKQIARFRAGARLEWLACDARLVPELRCSLADDAPIMVDPAITPEGETFERAAIGKKEPMLPLVRNLALRSILRRFAEARALRTAAAAKAAAEAAAEASAKAANAALRDAHKERLARKQAATAAAAAAVTATAAAAAENGGNSATASTNGALLQLLAVPRPVLRRCISSPPASPSRDVPSTLRSHSLRADQLAVDRLVLCH
jgi:trimeric autotransporter adhesin